MKKIIRHILPGLALLCLLALPASAQTRVGTVDLRKLFDNYVKRKQAAAALDQRRAELNKEKKTYLDDYNKVKEDYNKLLAASLDQSVTPEEREKRKTAAENKLQELKSSENTIRTFDSNATEQLENQTRRMRETILQEIQAAVQAKAKLAGVNIVIDTAAESANNTPIVLFSNVENDLTDTVLSQLNAGAPPDSTPAPAPSPDVKKDKTK